MLTEETLGSPQRYFEQVSGNIAPAQRSCIPGVRSMTDIEVRQKLPNRKNTTSRVPMTMLPAEADIAIPEPRMIPGILHEKERRRSRRVSRCGEHEDASTETA